MVAGLIVIHQKKQIENPKSWLVTVLNHKYYDMLRRKYRKPIVSLDLAGEIPVCDCIYEQIDTNPSLKS